MMSGNVRARIRVTGRVQGVFFRAETRGKASSLGLSGWVANRPDGSVEAVFEGPESKVNEAIEWARAGPPAAVVESVEVDWDEPQGIAGFSIRR